MTVSDLLMKQMEEELFKNFYDITPVKFATVVHRCLCIIVKLGAVFAYRALGSLLWETFLRYISRGMKYDLS